MQNSRAYGDLMRQLHATGVERKDGYDLRALEKIYDWERNEVEKIIWDAFENQKRFELAPILPQLKNYNGIMALKRSPYLHKIPSDASVKIAKALYESTGEEKYLDIIKENIDANLDEISYVSTLSYCKPCSKQYRMLAEIYINNENPVSRSIAVDGLLHCKGIIEDLDSCQEYNNTLELCKKFSSEDREERLRVLKEFEKSITEGREPFLEDQ